MTIIRNRELSQFGSFIYIDDASQSIGITTEGAPNVGIGTNIATVKLEVVGDTNISGVLTVNQAIDTPSFLLNGVPLVDVSENPWQSGDEGDIYRLEGNVSIGTSIATEKLTVDGNVSVSGDISALKFISTEVSPNAPFVVSSNELVTNLNADFLRGKVAPSGTIVGTTDAQILTQKTINLSNNTLSGTLSEFNAALSNTNFVSLDGTETLTNKTFIAPVITSISPGPGQLQTIPSGIGTLLSTNSASFLTNEMIADGSITNSKISPTAAIQISKLAFSTISGVSLGNNLNSLTAGSFVNYSSGTTYNGSSPITISVAATTGNVANTIVARNSSGDFVAGSIQAATFNATTSDSYNVNGTVIINSNRNIVNVVNGIFSGSVTATTFNGALNGSATVAQGLTGTPDITVGVVTATTFNGTLNSSIGTITTLNSTNNNFTNISCTGISTFLNGPILIGTAALTGTVSQPLQVTGGAYVSGNLGVGVANPTQKLEVNGVGQFVNNGNQLHLHTGTNSPTVIHRNDSANYYILLSDSATSPSGTWNTLRPLTINLSNGLLTSSNGVSFSRNSTSPVISVTQNGTGYAFIVNDQSVDRSPFAINRDGDCGIGTLATGGFKLAVRQDTGADPAVKIQLGTTSSTSVRAIDFRDRNNVNLGEIICNTVANTTSYITVSDYRLKENVTTLTNAITRLNNLRPSRFNFIKDPEKVVFDGFIAHEVQEVVPQAVSGNKDELDEDGSIKSQGIDYGKLVPLLTAALQESIAEIEDLKNRVKELESIINT